MFGLINLIVNILILGALVHWALVVFNKSYNETAQRIKEALDRIYLPMLEVIRGFVKPFQLSDGNSFDFSHLILILLLAIFRKFAFWLF